MKSRLQLGFRDSSGFEVDTSPLEENSPSVDIPTPVQTTPAVNNHGFNKIADATSMPTPPVSINAPKQFK